MTTNAGAPEVSRASIGFTQQDHSSDAIAIIKKSFSPEFRNRLDAIIQFTSLDSRSIKRVVDKLVEVALVQGGDQWIHLHIEIQSSRESDFAERMMIYHYRIFDRFRRPVASLAVLADNQPGWRPGPYRQSTLGCQWILDFPNAKLLDYRRREKDLAGSDNPFGLVTLAHLRTQGTRNQSARRYRAKYRLIRSLYGKGWAKSRIIQLLRIIDWLMALPPHLEQSLRQRITAIEGETHMQYVTSFERLAKQDGVHLSHQRGRAQQIGLSCARSGASDVHPSDGAALAQQDGATRRGLPVGVVSYPDSGDAGDASATHQRGRLVWRDGGRTQQAFPIWSRRLA